MPLGKLGIILIVLVFMLSSTLHAQVDSIPAPQVTKGKVTGTVITKTDSVPIAGMTVKKDSTKANSIPVHSPKKAALYSAILPGAGQVYNRKYWKVGVIAVGAGALVYSLNFNQRNFSLYKGELVKRQQGLGGLDEGLALYTDANLNELQDFYRRNRDLTVVGMALLYALNVIDATVDAHLFDFNVNDDLSMRIRPEAVFSFQSALPSPGIGLTLSF